MSCPKGKSCSCGGKGRWEPMCEGIEEYVNQDYKDYPVEKHLQKKWGDSFTLSVVLKNRKQDVWFERSEDELKKLKYVKTKECKYLPFLTRRSLYAYSEKGIITKKQYLYIRKYFFWRMSYREIAKFYRKSSSTIWETVQRGITRIKKYLLR